MWNSRAQAVVRNRPIRSSPTRTRTSAVARSPDQCSLMPMSGRHAGRRSVKRPPRTPMAELHRTPSRRRDRGGRPGRREPARHGRRVGRHIPAGQGQQAGSHGRRTHILVAGRRPLPPGRDARTATSRPAARQVGALTLTAEAYRRQRTCRPGHCPPRPGTRSTSSCLQAQMPRGPAARRLLTSAISSEPVHAGRHRRG